MQKEDLIHGVQPSLHVCNAVDTHAPQVDAPACAMPSHGSFQPPLRVDCNILDGGGLGSSADWLVPRVSEDLFLQLRRKFQSWALEWRVVDRLRKHVAAKCSNCLFTKAEIHLLQAGLVEFLNSRGHTCNSCVEPHQPFLLSAWRALAEFVQDIDGSLANVLSEGVPTGIVEPIPASGVWERLEEPINVADEPDLVVHDQPWKSAQSDPVLVQTLLRKDIDAGHLVHLPGGESAARERWGDRLAAGKFGLVTTPGKKPRLVGDGTISGANGRSRILEKVRLPSLDSVQRFISSAPAEQVWSALSFDVRGAHKLVRVREDEQGYSCFVLEGEWYFYRSCYFGCKWAAYWFARVGSLFGCCTGGYGYNMDCFCMLMMGWSCCRNLSVHSCQLQLSCSWLRLVCRCHGRK